MGKYHGLSNGTVVDAHQGDNHTDDWIVIPNNHLAIIDQQTFDAVQQRLSERKQRTTPHKNGGKFLLTGLLHCGKCGGRMFGTDPRKTQAVSYICGTDLSTDKCDRNAAKQDELQEFLKSAQTPTRTRLAEVDAKVNKSMGRFARLRETLQQADTVHLRELLRQTIDKVEVWSNPVMRGRRWVFQLERGVIHLRSDELNKLLLSTRLWPRARKKSRKPRAATPTS